MPSILLNVESVLLIGPSSYLKKIKCIALMQFKYMPKLGVIRCKMFTLHTTYNTNNISVYPVLIYCYLNMAYGMMSNCWATITIMTVIHCQNTQITLCLPWPPTEDIVYCSYHGYINRDGWTFPSWGECREFRNFHISFFVFDVQITF